MLLFVLILKSGKRSFFNVEEAVAEFPGWLHKNGKDTLQHNMGSEEKKHTVSPDLRQTEQHQHMAETLLHLIPICSYSEK